MGDKLRNLRLHRGLLLEYFSIVWMVIEASASVGAGFLEGSLALVAFGGDSLVELLSAYAVASYLRSVLYLPHSYKEGEVARSSLPDSERTEKIATILLFALIPAITIGGAYSYINRIPVEGSPLGIAVAVGAAVVMPYLWIGKERIGRETGCRPLSIDAVESATCFFMAVALLGGLLVEFFLKISWVDYVTTGIILVFVAREAVESYHETSKEEKD